MTIEVKDNGKIQTLNNYKENINEFYVDLIQFHKIDILSHKNKIDKLIDNAIKKERIAILNSEIEKIKKGGN